MAHTLITDVAAEVEVPADGTLSRVLHQDGRLRLVVFAFDTGQELTEHTASRPAVIQIVNGRVEMHVAGEKFGMSPGGWLLLDAGVPHSLNAVEPSVVLLTLLA